MQHYTLHLFRRDDSGFDLRILDNRQQLLQPATWVEQSDIDTLAALTADEYSTQASDLQERGERLFNWVDRHSNGWLRKMRLTPQHSALHIDIEAGNNDAGLRHLPWELLHDGTQFLCADPLHLFTPIRRASTQTHDWQPQKRQLGVLFMASSPEDVQPVLDFEAEEAAILTATNNKPLDLQVEESGSLPGLQERLTDMAEAPDVIHLSGHANVYDEFPMFLLEDEFGNLAQASPLDVAHTLLEADSYPRILFLSGCRTGESSRKLDMLSFSEQVVQAGVPVVLGWALPVGDSAASLAAALLYEKLATGFEIASAVAFARQQLHESRSPYWHLLRCFSNASALNPLVAKGRLRVRRHDSKQQFLEAAGGHCEPVCARTQFVGRRRLLQRCLKSLRAWYGDDAYAEGVLLYGMGGLGKSSAAARLVDRLRNTHEPVVCYGGLDETVLLAAIGKALPHAQSLLNDAKLTLEQRLRTLFEPENNTYCTKPLLLVLDDFEKNIPVALRQQGKTDYSHDYTPASLSVLNTVMQAIHDSQSDTRVILTCRYAVPFMPPCRWHEENPQTLHGADLKKKLAQLHGLTLQGPDATTPANTLRQRAVEIAAGNPRLLEWLDKILLDNSQPVEALLDKLAQEEARFREDILIHELVSAQTAAVRHVLACAALYRLPVQLAAVEALSNDPDTAQHLQTAARVGLVESTDQADSKRYFVSNLLDAVLATDLSQTKHQQLAAQASRYLYDATLNSRPEEWAKEMVRLAVAGQEKDIAVEVGHRLAFRLLREYRLHEARTLCQDILMLGEDFRILTTLATAEQTLGNGATANQQIERAVQLIPVDKTALPDDLLKESAYTLGAYADILQARGQLDEALNIRQTEQLPVYEKLGDVRSLLVGRAKLAILLWQMDAAVNAGRIQELLCLALNDARRLRIPEAEQIESILEQMGLSCELPK